MRAVLILDRTPYYQIEVLKRSWLRSVWTNAGYAHSFEEARKKLQELAALPEIINQPNVAPLDKPEPDASSHVHTYSDTRMIRFVPYPEMEVTSVATNEAGTRLEIITRNRKP